MNTNHVFFIVLTMFCSHLFAQTTSKKVQIEWGQEEKTNKHTDFKKIISYNQSSFITLSGSPSMGKLRGTNTSVLGHYNNNLQKLKTVVNESINERNTVFEDIIEIGGELYLFYTILDNKAKQNSLYIKQIDKTTLRYRTKGEKLAEINYEGSRRYNSGSFGIDYSRDSSKILIFYNTPFKKGEQEKFGFHVFDNNMNQLYHKFVTLPYIEELFDVEDFVIDNEGNIHVLGLLFNEKRTQKRKGLPNYEYRILSYYNVGEEVIEYPVKIKGVYLKDMRIVINSNRDIVCAGFYSSDENSRVTGCFFLKIDSKTKNVIEEKTNEFQLDIITQNLSTKKEEKVSRKAAKGKNIDMPRFDLRNIVLRDDGGILLIGEQYKVVVHTHTSTNAQGVTTTSYTYTYYYDDIIVVNLHPNGSIDWAQKIAKMQRTNNDNGYYSSYALAIVEDRLFFIFNDNPQNLFYKGSGLPKAYSGIKKSLVMLVEINNKGEQSREALFTAKQAGLYTRPKVCMQISSNEMIMYTRKKNNIKLAKVRFSD